MPVGGLDIWSNTVKTKCRGRGQAKEEGWSMKKEEREIMDTWTI